MTTNTLESLRFCEFHANIHLSDVSMVRCMYGREGVGQIRARPDKFGKFGATKRELDQRPVVVGN